MYVVPSAYHQFITSQHVKDGLQECLPSVHLLTKQRLKFDLELCERILRHHKVGMVVSVLNGSKVRGWTKPWSSTAFALRKWCRLEEAGPS